MPRTALVTGGNRGLGLEVCRQLAQQGLRVILTARDPEHAEDAAESLRSEGLDVLPEAMDVAEEDAVHACAVRLRAEGQQVDVLVNNAAVYSQGEVLSLSTALLEDTLRTNLYGVLWCCQVFVPPMVQRGYGRVVNVSSEDGSLAGGLDGPAPYALSKAALNALTVRLADEVSGDVKVNAVCPGWVRTRMGGPGAPRDVQEGAESIVWAATLPADGPSGGFFRDGEPLDW